jgi:hypothetical protein
VEHVASETAWLAAAVPSEAACDGLISWLKVSHGACSPTKVGISDQPMASVAWIQLADRLP